MQHCAKFANHYLLSLCPRCFMTATGRNSWKESQKGTCRGGALPTPVPSWYQDDIEGPGTAFISNAVHIPHHVLLLQELFTNISCTDDQNPGQMFPRISGWVRWGLTTNSPSVYSQLRLRWETINTNKDFLLLYYQEQTHSHLWKKSHKKSHL